jgi:phosphopantothenoylcysteine decarboxylase / phosphopantothenate---cysteine ligase
MGIALALEAARLGARVVLISGPVPVDLPNVKNVRVVPILSARELDRAVQKNLKGTSVFIGSAAVADFRPAQVARQKLKMKAPTLHLVKNPDVIHRVARSAHRPPLVVGFALETQHVIKNAFEKLRRKNLDWIVANRESNIGSNRGSVMLLSKSRERVDFPRMTKSQLAGRIWKAIVSETEIHG